MMLFLLMNICRWFLCRFLEVMVVGLIGLIRFVLFLCSRWCRVVLLVMWLID